MWNCFDNLTRHWLKMLISSRGREYSFIPLCLTTGPKPLLKRVLRRLRSSASSFDLQYTPFALRSSSSCLLLILHLPVTSLLPTIFPSITCFRRQFLRKMWPIQSAFLLLFFVEYSPPPGLFALFLHFSHDRSKWSSPFFSSTTF